MLRVPSEDVIQPCDHQLAIEESATRSSLDSSPEASSRDMSSAPTTPPSVDKVDGFSRKSVRKARQKRSQSSSQFRSQGKPIELTPLPLLKGRVGSYCFSLVIIDELFEKSSHFNA
ncbi:Hypothetical predicted protein [Marmota monax]|uniref:Uncharacterized protein n=2 Tax=Amniota TaxID=32524 RepID=A0A5E4BTN2_MARMO|nr:hypothetical protein GHT09_004546 [Marmota monax]VTJ72967.1 Hypothetical predicted protein [Marmota monax]